MFLATLVKKLESDSELLVFSAWSLMDNFEWARGYAERFGLYWTNFTDPGRATYRKKSADFYANIVTTNKVPPS